MSSKSLDPTILRFLFMYDAETKLKVSCIENGILPQMACTYQDSYVACNNNEIGLLNRSGQDSVYDDFRELPNVTENGTESFYSTHTAPFNSISNDFTPEMYPQDQELPQQLWEIIQHDNSSAEILYALTLRQLMLHGDVQDFSDDLVGLLPLSCEFQLLDKNRQLLLDDLLEKSSHPNRSSATGLHSQPIYDLILIKNIKSDIIDNTSFLNHCIKTITDYLIQAIEAIKGKGAQGREDGGETPRKRREHQGREFGGETLRKRRELQGREFGGETLRKRRELQEMEFGGETPRKRREHQGKEDGSETLGKRRENQGKKDGGETPRKHREHQGKEDGGETPSKHRDNQGKEYGGETPRKRREHQEKEDGGEAPGKRREHQGKEDGDETPSKCREHQGKEDGGETLSEHREHQGKEDGDETPRKCREHQGREDGGETTIKHHLKTIVKLRDAQDYGGIHLMVDCLLEEPVEEYHQKAALWIAKGDALQEDSKFEDAYAIFKKCAEHCEKNGLKGDACYCYFRLGKLELLNHRPASAIWYFQRALDLYDNKPSAVVLIEIPKPAIGSVYLLVASAYKNKHEVDDALHFIRQAIAAPASSTSDLAAAHINLGNLLHFFGDHTGAVPHYKKGIELSETCGDMVSYAWAHGNLGNTYLSLSQHKEALHYLQLSLELTFDHECTPVAIGRAHNNLGTYYQAVGDLETAQYHYDIALAQGVYGQDIPGQARAYGNIGNVYMLRKNQERAIPHYTEVLRLSRDRNTVVVAQHNRGCAYFELGEKKKALEQVPRCQYQYVVSGHSACKMESEHQMVCLSPEVTKHYQYGLKDLVKVIEAHEETFSNIKGSSRGLSLSVHWFETNIKTFLRAQDCAYNVGDHRSLLFAEQCRARTLGELLHNKKWLTLDKTFRSPLQLDDISSAVRCLNKPNVPVVVLSYTGTRLLVWVLVWDGDEVRMSAFEQEPTEELFDGQTFDQYVRYTLSEMLTGSLQIYGELGDQKLSDDAPAAKLFELIGKPLLRILDAMGCSGSSIVFIPDSYTKLLPFSALYDSNKQCYLGDSHSIVYSPSLLTLGVMSQTPAVEVHVPLDSEDMCVVGNPNTPPFRYNDEEWDLGPLPFATEEARSVAHMLQCTPLLHEEATKSAVMAKIGRAKMIHLATHGSAGGGFLVLGTVNHSLGTALRHTVDDPDTLLLKASEVESVDIPAALVVLSSCDSGRGVIRGDDIQGMARSFLLAGARAVLTSLWKAPDESASFFMQYFYRYLLDGRKASEALQKTSLSIRCFVKYSNFVHWSGHQLTGQDVTVTHELSSQDRAIQVALGRVEIVGTEQQLDSNLTTQLVASPFPRFNVVHKLVEDLANINSSLTDVQLLCGPPGVDLMEPVVDYICSHHTHYSGGIAWLPVHAVHHSSALQELSQCSRNDRILVVVDCSDDITSFSNLSHSLLNSHNTDVIVITNWLADDAKQHVKHALKRPVSVCEVQPLSVLHATQRLVYAVQSKHHLPPLCEDQTAFQQLAHLSTGSPVLVRLIQSLLHHHIECSDTASDGLQNCLKELKEIVGTLYDDDDDDDEFLIKTQALVTATCDTLSTSSQRLLHCLSCLDGMPVSQEFICHLAASISPYHQPHVMMAELRQAAVLLGYPSPVVCGLTDNELYSFFHVPQTIAEAVWSNSSIHNKCLSLLLMKQVVMTVHQPHTACLCHRVIQALETTMISDCQKQDSFIVAGLKDCVLELTEHYVSRSSLPADTRGSSVCGPQEHSRQYELTLFEYQPYLEHTPKCQKEMINQHLSAFLVPVEEDSKDVILDIQAPDCEKQDSRLKHQALVVSKASVTMQEVTKPDIVKYQPVPQYTVSKQVYEAITMPEMYTQLDVDALVAQNINSKNKNSYYYKDDGGDDFSATVSTKPTAQEWLATALCARHYSDKLVRALPTDDGMSTKLLQSLLVCAIQTIYFYTSLLLKAVYLSTTDRSIADALPDFLTEYTSRSFKQHDFRKIIHDSLQEAFLGTEKSNASGVFDAVAKLLISSAIKSSVPNASSGALNMRKEHKNLSKVKTYSLSTPDSVKSTEYHDSFKIAIKVTPCRLFSHDYYDSHSFSHDCVCMIGYNESHGFEQKLEALTYMQAA